MSKAGNAHLRAAAYRMAVVGITHDPVIKAHERQGKAIRRHSGGATRGC